MAVYPEVQSGQRVTGGLLRSMLPQFAYKSTHTDRTGTTLTDDPDLTLEVEASAVYLVELDIFFGGQWNDDGENDGDFVTNWTVPAGSTGLKSVLGPGVNAAEDATNSAGSVTTVRLGVHQLTTPVPYAAVRNVTANLQVAREVGTVTTTDAGTLALAWAQEDPDATLTRVGLGSSMRVTRLA